MKKTVPVFFALPIIWSFLAFPHLAFSSSDHRAQAILEQSKFAGGLIVHVGCGDGKLTAALGKNKQYVVQGLERDRDKVQQARHALRSHGEYGRLSIKHWAGGDLPYADNLVNLLIVEENHAEVPADEIKRVLAPRGKALIPKGMARNLNPVMPFNATHVIYTKPVPAEIDDWTHYLHGADNNAVARDTRVGPPQSMQWVNGPPYFRSHEINPSMAALVSADGRLFYIWDDGLLGQPHQTFPEKWSLIARDAFNGMLLWKRHMPNWGWRQWHKASRWDNPRERARMLWQMPVTTPRRLVAVDNRIYVTLGYQAPVSVLDATTGKTLQTIKGTEQTDEILFETGMLVLLIREPTDKKTNLKRDFRLSHYPGRVVAVEAKSGHTKWASELANILPMGLAAAKDRVYYATDQHVVCLDRENGQRLWQSDSYATPSLNRATRTTLVAQERVVLCANGPVSRLKNDYLNLAHYQINAFSVETGKRLWAGIKYAGPGQNPDIFVIDNLVWLGTDGQANQPILRQDVLTQRQGFDLLSGEVKKGVTVPKLTSPGHHYRCYRSKATERFLLFPKRGVEFFDLQGNDHMRHDWLRAPCSYGVLPANGILYTAPHPCVCYQGVLMSNFNALTSSRVEDGGQKSEDRRRRTEDRLIKSQAYSQIRNPKSKIRNKNDWPMYRRDAKRSASIKLPISDKPRKQWQTKLTAPITPPVVARGQLLVAEKDKHTIQAFDATNGQKLWSYTAGARIDSPPSLYGPLVLFGSADGWVYCLNANNGSEIWRFQAAPGERQIGAFGQLESSWPVHGSVIVHEDNTVTPPRPLVYFTAGRSSYLDGGIRVYALDPYTGKQIYETCLDGPRPDPYKDTGTAGYMDGSKTDILVSDGADLFLLQERFRSDLIRYPARMQKLERESGGFREYPAYPERDSNAMRLMSTRGFLDDSYNEGTYWTYSKSWPGWDRHMGRVGVYGQLLVFDDRTVYGVHVFTERTLVRRAFTPGQKGYRLFAKNYDPQQNEREYRRTKDNWSEFIPLRVRAMVLAGDRLFIVGPPDVVDESDPLGAFEGRRGSDLWAMSAKTGKKLAEIHHFDALPVYDGLIAARGCLYLSSADGQVTCFGE